MDRNIFEHRVKAMWPKATIHRVASISRESHIAVVQISEDKPFFVGLRYGLPVPLELHTVHEARQYYREIVNELDGVMAVMSVLLAPHESRDWTAFNKLLGITPTD